METLYISGLTFKKSSVGAKYPKFSVVIAAYNEEKYLAATLERIRAQDYPGPVELIVVDNNSSDKTSQIAFHYADKVLLEKAGPGPAASLALGAKAANGEYLAFTDADTLPPKDWLSRAHEKFSQNPKAVTVGGPYYFYDGLWPANFIFLLLNRLSEKLFFKYRPGLAGSNTIVKKWAYERTGGINPKLQSSQDSDLSIRLSEVGKVLYDNNFAVLTSFRRYQRGRKNPLFIYSYLLWQFISNSTSFLKFWFLGIPRKARKPFR